MSPPQEVGVDLLSHALFIFTSSLMTLQPTPLKHLNLSLKSIGIDFVSLGQPELCRRQRPLQIITRLSWCPADASSTGRHQQMLLGFSFSTPLRQEGPLPPPFLPLSLHPPARPAGWQSLVLFALIRCLIGDNKQLKKNFLAEIPASFNWIQHNFCKELRTQSFHLSYSGRVGWEYCHVLLDFLPWRLLKNFTSTWWKKATMMLPN